MDSMEQSPESSDALPLAEQFANFYAMFLSLAQGLADKKGIKMPTDLPVPDDIAKLSADTPEGYEKIMNALNHLVDFTQENNLCRHTTPQEMASFVEQHISQKTPEGEALQKLAQVKNAISMAIDIRLKLANFMEFQEQESQLLEPIYNKKDVIETVAKEIAEAGFPVDGRKLITNYLNVAKKDPDKAYDVLIHNPATFAPIETKSVKEGKLDINPDEGRKINQKLAKFLKHLKV